MRLINTPGVCALLMGQTPLIILYQLFQPQLNMAVRDSTSLKGAAASHLYYGGCSMPLSVMLLLSARYFQRYYKQGCVPSIGTFEFTFYPFHIA